MSFVTPQMRESLARHVLVPALDSGKFEAFLMKRPGEGRIMSTMIVFTPEGIVITGDLCPRAGTRGIVSDAGYGTGWFRGRLSERYLCEKFLTDEWQLGLAASELREEIGDLRDEDGFDIYVQKLETIAEMLEHETIDSGQDLHDHLNNAGYETADGIPGMDYNLADAGWLCAIQQRFAELYNERVARKVAWQTHGLGYALSS